MGGDISIVEALLDEVGLVVDVVAHLVSEVLKKVAVGFWKNSKFCFVDLEGLRHVCGELLVLLGNELKYFVVLWVSPKLIKLKVGNVNEIDVLENVVTTSQTDL